MKTDRILTEAEHKAIKRKQDQFPKEYYQELDKCVATNSRKYLGDQSELAAQVMIKLVEVIYRKAFLDDGWLDDLSCLKQSKTKAYFLTLDEMETQIKRDQTHVSYDAAASDCDEGSLAPSEWISSDRTEDPEALLMQKQLTDHLRSFCENEYQHALLDCLLGHQKPQDVVREYGVHANTVTNNKAELYRRIVSQTIIKDWI